ncbi:hypothetical protein CPB83DRAFT_365894 [Crepidotus variabilis]|uniref:F-box domain-containing protein n=1 Tax=Crepidotus variabilis TaxID=179855 RepID=A0A9P6EFB5_9AGAR|nr:hypothetical protein CPB83DRAFT_365894 [Crepidotus variabilis]
MVILSDEFGRSLCVSRMTRCLLSFMSPPMQDIPLEIWQHVTSFLTKEEVCQLYGVNHALYSIAMDQLYRECTIGSPLHAMTKRYLSRLRDVEVARLVRKIQIAPDDLFRHIDMEKNSQRPIPEAALIAALSNLHLRSRDEPQSRKLRLPGGPPKPNVKAMQSYNDILFIMSQLTSVTELELRVSKSEPRFFMALDLPSAIITPGWKTFGSTLRSLYIQAPVESLSYLLPLEKDLALPDLGELYLDLVRADLSTDVSLKLSSTILPFLRSQKDTITMLKLHFRDPIDIGSFLSNIPRMPNLHSFSLTQLTPNDELAEAGFHGLKRFLQTHARQLTSFDFESSASVADFQVVPPVDIFFANSSWSDTTLPALQLLGVDLFPVGPNHGLINFIHRFATTLVSLKIYHHFFVHEDLAILLNCFRGDKPLRGLRISVKRFTPSIFTMFAACVPNLKNLQLHFGVVAGTLEQTAGTDSDAFTNELSSLYFPKFKLQTLALEDMFRFGGEFYPRRIALLKALPNVEILSGKTRLEYSSEL